MESVPKSEEEWEVDSFPELRCSCMYLNWILHQPKEQMSEFLNWILLHLFSLHLQQFNRLYQVQWLNLTNYSRVRDWGHLCNKINEHCHACVSNWTYRLWRFFVKTSWSIYQSTPCLPQREVTYSMQDNLHLSLHSVTPHTHVHKQIHAAVSAYVLRNSVMLLLATFCCNF